MQTFIWAPIIMFSKQFILTRAFIDVTADLKSINPWTFFTPMFSFIFYVPGLCQQSSSTRLRTFPQYPIIPLTMDYIMNLIKFALNIYIHLEFNVIKITFQIELLTRTFSDFALFDFVRMSIACTSICFRNILNSRINSCANSTCGGALSQNPFIPYTMNSWNPKFVIGSQYYHVLHNKQRNKQNKQKWKKSSYQIIIFTFRCFCQQVKLQVQFFEFTQNLIKLLSYFIGLYQE